MDAAARCDMVWDRGICATSEDETLIDGRSLYTSSEAQAACMGGGIPTDVFPGSSVGGLEVMESCIGGSPSVEARRGLGNEREADVLAGDVRWLTARLAGSAGDGSRGYVTCIGNTPRLDARM